MVREPVIEKLLVELILLMKKCQWRQKIKLLKNNDSVQKDWELAWNLGWCYFKIHNLKLAEVNFKLAFRLIADNLTHKSICYWALGLVYKEQQLYRKAEKYLSRSS